MIVVIDPGHGGRDPGAVGPTGLQEKDVTLAVALKVANILRQAGIDVKLTRTSDAYVDLQPRCDIANSVKAEYFISIHCNAVDNPAAHGTETFCYKFGGQGEVLAKIIQAELIATTSRANRGIKEANFYVLRKTNMPAVLVELAFISSLEEERLLGSFDFQEKCATAIARGIGEMFGIREVLSMFKDVPKNNWAADSIKRLAKIGIVAGDGQSNFRPDQPITRAEVAAILDRVLKLLGK